MEAQISVADAIVRRFRRVTASTTFVPQVDGLRCLAIVAVFVYHVRGFLNAKSPYGFSPPVEEDWLARLTLHGDFGVLLFFTVSGFVLALPFANGAFQSKSVGLKRYLLRRVTRLEPPYFVAMTLASILLCWVNGISGAVLLPHLLAGLGYIHNLVYGEGNLINGVAWSLEVEVQFYLLMPLFAFVFRVRSRALRRSFLCAGIGGFILLQIRCVSPQSILSLTLLNFLPYFLVGLLLADLYLLDCRRALPLTRRWDALGLAAWLLLVVALLLPWPLWGGVFAPILLLPAVYSVFRGRVIAALFSNRWVTVIGGMCYSLYLLHYLVVSAVGRFAVNLRLTELFWVNLIFQCLIVAPFVLAIASVFFLLVEKPCMREKWPQELAAWLRGPGFGRTRSASAGKTGL